VPADVVIKVRFVRWNVVKVLGVFQPVSPAPDAVVGQGKFLCILPVGGFIIVTQQRQPAALGCQLLAQPRTISPAGPWVTFAMLA